ncbi:hypothetical protein [Photobacterium kishitanii]|uniref:Uncharacterized protein n=1 Tax=Photobacterium kishitanii TaxID=318456 RepID=A0A2T3KL17_9GAMM|nr:hypothetical protein [Photobacterium kishitanii]PSV00402.1 hypothetical protein C9J27_04540 [Photobacterium kishitanii]
MKFFSNTGNIFFKQDAVAFKKYCSDSSKDKVVGIDLANGVIELSHDAVNVSNLQQNAARNESQYDFIIISGKTTAIDSWKIILNTKTGDFACQDESRTSASANIIKTFRYWKNID